MSLTSIAANIVFNHGDKKRDKGLITPKNIIRHDNISYGDGGKWNLLDVYYNIDTTKKNPVIVNIHGGGWVYGTKEVYQYYLMSLAQKGFTVVNANYHLAPHKKFPTQLEDVNNVIEWVYKNADKYFMNTKSIYLVGDSAGAHLNALYACICTNPEYSKKYNFKVPHNFVPKALALNCGMYDIDLLMKDDKNLRRLVRDLLGKGYTKKDLERIVVRNHITKDFPTSFIMSGTGDFLMGEVGSMVLKLDEINVPYKMKIYGTEENKLPHVFHCDIKNEDARRCNEEQIRFFLDIESKK